MNNDWEQNMADRNESAEKYRCDFQSILFSTGIMHNNKFISFSSSGCIPMTTDLQNGEVAFIDDLTDYIPFRSDEMISDGENICVLELNGNRLMYFNIYEKVCRYYDINCHTQEWGNFAVFAKYGNRMYIFPRYHNKVLIINYDSCRKKLIVKEKNYPDTYKSADDGQERLRFNRGCQSENMVWLIETNGDFLIGYDMKEDRWEKHRISLEMHNCAHMVDFKGKLYLLDSGGKIYYWDKTAHTIKKVAECGGGIEKEFGRIAVTERNIFILPSFGKNIFTISLDTGRIKLYNDYPVDFKYSGSGRESKYYGYCEDENQYFFAMWRAAYILCINKRNGSAEWIKAQLPLYDEYIRICMKYRGAVDEMENSLAKFLGVAGNSFRDIRQCGCNLIGKQIWNKVAIRL